MSLAYSSQEIRTPTNGHYIQAQMRQIRGSRKPNGHSAIRGCVCAERADPRVRGPFTLEVVARGPAPR